MARQLKQRWKWVALVVLLQATLLVSLATAQSDFDSARQNWRSTNSHSPLVNITGPVQPWQQEKKPAEVFAELAPPNPPEQHNSGESMESGSLSLTSYFETLNDEDKAKYSWNLPGGWRIVPTGKLRGELMYAQNSTTADVIQFFFSPNTSTMRKRVDILQLINPLACASGLYPQCS